MVNLKYFKIFEKEIYLKESDSTYQKKPCDIPAPPIKKDGYWNSRDKTEEEKIKEIVDKIDPIFKTVKEYYLKYFNGGYFTSKIKEKFEKSEKSWDSLNLKSLIDFVNSITYLTYPPKTRPLNLTNTNTIAWVDSLKFGVVNYDLFYINLKDPQWDYAVYRTTVHEMRHCIDLYFSDQGIDIVPGKDDKLATLYAKRKKGGKLTSSEIKELTDEEVNRSESRNLGDFEKNVYDPSGLENSARIQGLKVILGIDDFVSAENLSKLLKTRLKANQIMTIVDYKGTNHESLNLQKLGNKYYKALDYDCPLEIDFKEEGFLNIPLKEKGDVYCVDFRFIDYENPEDPDVQRLFRNFVGDTEENKIKIDLNKLYKYSLEFAKNNSDKEENREQRS